MTPQTDPVRAGYRGSALPDRSGGTSPAAAVAGAFRRRQPVEWRGQVYPNISAAAKAAGVSRQAFTEAMRRGSLHMVGTGPHRLDTRQPCGAHGWLWASQREAAAALGVRRETVTDHLERGTFDRLVLRRLGIHSAAAGPPPVVN